MPLRSKKKKTIFRRPRPIPADLREKIALCASFPQDVLFLDIETTGLSHYYDEITVVGWSLDGKAKTFIKGDDYTHLLKDAAQAKALVTFNGIRFDAPFLRQEFPEISLPDVHIDLMYLCRRVALTGGQKAIENELDLNFRDDLKDVDGFAAVLLWHRYLRGKIEALEKLIRYNRADIAAMGAIFDQTLTRLIIEPDLFWKSTEFVDWSAPEGWRTIPKNLKPATPDLSGAPSFENLFGKSSAATSRIVGIDLTGSEARGTGWCLLEGSHATVATISTDSDIVEHTLATNPDLISIDSPLCLPYGRITVEDSDPGRDEYGIMRQCERTLKRRGVNVYPSLLPSMQKLTARGIRLAKIFREKGVPVIESYPGAAQDIMRIPRKGAGAEWLQLGLSDFGITGDYLTEKVTHDELDAITSALVGTFHLAGFSEALGTEDEPPLIIPKLDGQPGPIVVGVSGPIAAGKTTFAKELEKRGFAYTRFSLAIEDLLKQEGLELNRVNRQERGTQINQNGQQRWLAERTLSLVGDAELIVVDGLRFPEDHAFLVERFGNSFHHIFVHAKKSTRRKRYQGRSTDIDFDKATHSTVESRVADLRQLAHEIFLNQSSLDKVQVRVDELVCNCGENKCQFQS